MIFSLIKDIQPLLLKSDRQQWAILLGASLASGLSRSLFLAIINTAVALNGDWHDMLPYTAGAIALIGVMICADFFGAVRGRRVSLSMAMRLRNRLLDQIGSANLRFVEHEKATRLHYHLINTIFTIAGTYGLFLAFSNGLATLVFNLIYMGWLSPAGLLVALLIILVGVAVHGRFERINQLRRPLIDELNNRLHGTHQAYLLGYKELRLSNRKTIDYRNQIEDVNADFLRESVQEASVSAKGAAATNLFQYVAIAIIGLALPILLKVESVVAMQLLAAILFTIGPLTSVVSAFASFGVARIAFNNLSRLTAAVSATREPGFEGALATLPPFESFALRGVTFQFSAGAPSSPLSTDDEMPATGEDANEEFRLGPIDLTIKRGEVVCIVGGNGSGKTVLMRLLTGLYRPDTGELLYNGLPLSDAQRQSYREQFTAVFSDFFLFLELLGRREYPPEKVEAWLEHFGLKGKTRVRNGEFTTVDLSTGQRKRMALVVSILDNRPIMVLDEFSAEQDPEHRHLFYREWLPQLREMGKTIIVVSHDDRYFDAADRVIRMDYGKIVSDGPVSHTPERVVTPVVRPKVILEVPHD